MCEAMPTIDDRLRQIHQELMEATAGCRPDMHEPDEQDVKVRVVGDHLDNACGSYVGVDQIVKGYQEFVVCFQRFTGREFVYRQINLADLIALARLAMREDE